MPHAIHDPAASVVLRTDPRTRRTMQACMAAIIGLFVVLIALNLAGVIHRARGGMPPVPMGLVIIAMLGGVMLSVHRGRVVIAPDTVTVTQGLGRTRTFARADIVSRRVHGGGWRRSYYHELFLRDGTRVNLPPYLEEHAPLREFLHGIPLAPRR